MPRVPYLVVAVVVGHCSRCFIPNISPPSSDSDFPTISRSSKPSGSKRRASRAPRGSLLDAQTTVDSDVDDHQRDRLNFSFDRPCFFDTEVNVVGEAELGKFKSRFGIPDSVTLILPGDRAAWNPPENAVAIYGAMLSCGITLPLQPFIARFLAEAKIAPAQLAPNSYRILMCLGLMWKLKGFGSPTPREIRHFYTLRQAGNSGTYFLLSSPVENWIPEGVSNPGQVEVSSDEKKKGFIWGFPSSNKRWKNSWFFVGGEWGRNVSANSRLSLAARKVPRHFTSPDAWSKTVPVLLDAEISHLAAAAVLPLDERGRSFLLDEDKMIAKGLFPRLPARLPRLYDFDRVCDLQAQVVKNSEAASKRHAAGLAKEGVASLDGGDPSDDENIGDVDRERVELGTSPVCPDAAASTPTVTDSVAASTAASTAATAPSRKGKEKVGVSGVASEIPIFDANVPETPLDPSSDLNPRTGRGKRPVEGTPDRTARPVKRASRVVQYVVSSDEEVAEEPVLAEVPSAETTVPGASVEGPNLAESSFPEGASSFGATAIPPTSATPPPAAAEKPSSSFAGQPGSPGRQGPTDKPGSSRQGEAAASGSGVAHGAPPVDPAEAGEGDESVSLSDFTAAEICSYLMNNNVYVGESWEQIKKGSCNKKMEFFFNCYSLDLKRLREQSSLSEAKKLEAEETHAQQLAQLRESADGHLSARLAAEEKLVVAEEEIRLLREQLSASQESFAARLEVERLTEDAKERAEREAADLRNQLASHEVILTDLKAVLEVEAVDRFKRSPAYDALLLREFEKGMRQAKKFFAMKDHSTDKALRRFDRTDPHPMHLEIPSKRAFNTYYSGQKGSFSGLGAEPDLGPIAGRDYEPFMPEEDEEVIWPSKEEMEDEEDSEGPPTAG
ncbi:hypothetical protein LWI29_031558 [Acer saccharum]|uniref:Uncharacterized protein n=1 Tax=Acer saccharum TaxID=4024 RepID=A0AA39RFG7_ACESA|nr:hypothetical protein LWI29_031558 [Acer saccharum]